MSLDDRARRAATDLLDRAEEREVPALDDARHARRPRRALAAGAIAASVLAVVGVTVFVTESDGDVTPAMPGGGEARTWAPEGLGLSLQIPASWSERGPASGFAHGAGADGGDGHVLADRLHLIEPTDAPTVGADRAADLQGLGAFDIETSITVVDGRPAALHRYRLHRPGTSATKDVNNEYVVTEYDVPRGDWLLIVAVGERIPADRSEITEWILSTVEVGDVPAGEVPDPMLLEQPDALIAAPGGLETMRWSPEGFAVTMRVPSAWVEQTPQGAPWRVIYPPNGGPAASVSRITPREAGGREESVEYEGGIVDATAETVVDGRPTRAIQYRQAPRGYPLRITISIELLIDLGDGDVLLVRTDEHAGGEDHASLLRWIRSTIDLG